jgi:hypothetical protein
MYQWLGSGREARAGSFDGCGGGSSDRGHWAPIWTSRPVVTSFVMIVETMLVASRRSGRKFGRSETKSPSLPKSQQIRVLHLGVRLGRIGARAHTSMPRCVVRLPARSAGLTTRPHVAAVGWRRPRTAARSLGELAVLLDADLGHRVQIKRRDVCLDPRPAMGATAAEHLSQAGKGCIEGRERVHKYLSPVSVQRRDDYGNVHVWGPGSQIPQAGYAITGDITEWRCGCCTVDITQALDTYMTVRIA